MGKLQLRNLKGNNDYALWLMASEESDCYLLKENLAKLRTKWGMLGKFLLTNGIKWRYEVYRRSFLAGIISQHILSAFQRAS